MKICFRLNLEHRLDLVQRLGLESEFLGSFLVRTEKRLKQRRFQKGLILLDAEEGDYRSVLDLLLATFSPAWKRSILDFYRDGEHRLGDCADWKTINLIDQLMECAVTELTVSYEMLRSEGWLVGEGKPEPTPYVKSAVSDAVRLFVAPCFPGVPAQAAAA
jgi:hypothetical protein